MMIIIKMMMMMVMIINILQVSYIHRIGRTGRAGRRGEAVTFFTEQDRTILRTIAEVTSLTDYHLSCPNVISIPGYEELWL